MKPFLFLLSGMFILFSSPIEAQAPDLVGPTTEQEIREVHRIFDIYTKRYQPDEAAVEYLSAIEDSVTIYVLFGIWCHDSKREIPALFKTLEVANNPNIEVEYTAVSRQKTDPTNAYERWELKYTPTMVIFRYGEEIGRFIEESKTNLESELAQILRSGEKSAD